MADGDVLTVQEAARALGVSPRHARRLADEGAIRRVARGVVDRDSVDRYLRSRRQGRTRAWAEHTAWAAIALLAGHQAGWLGESQRSRLRGELRHLTDVPELLTRCRDRARPERFRVHRAALPRLRALAAVPDPARLGLAAAADADLDGYLSADELDGAIRTLGLVAAGDGPVVLRRTGFDIEVVRDLVATDVVAALDAATSADPRVRGVGIRALDGIVRAYG